MNEMAKLALTFLTFLAAFYMAESSPKGLLTLQSVGTGCAPDCIDHYRNCDPPHGLKSDKRTERINCREEYFQLRCPRWCSQCVQCDYGDDIDAINRALATENGKIDLLEDKHDKLDEKVDDQIDEIWDAIQS